MAISDQEFEDLAKAPKKTIGDEGSVEERSIDELIKAREYLNGQTTGANLPPFGLRIAQAKPRGTV